MSTVIFKNTELPKFQLMTFTNCKLSGAYIHACFCFTPGMAVQRLNSSHLFHRSTSTHKSIKEGKPLGMLGRQMKLLEQFQIKLFEAIWG